MVIGEIAIVLVVLVIVGGLVVRSLIRIQAKNPPLEHAIRLLDRVLASDDAVPQLPSALREDIARTVSTHYKEIQP